MLMRTTKLQQRIYNFLLGSDQTFTPSYLLGIHNFQPFEPELDLQNVTYINDGGFLLHPVKWHQNETYGAIYHEFVNYVQNHFG